MATQEEVQALFSRARGGERDAFDQLAGRFRRRLLSIIRHRMSKRLQRDAEPEDVYQETLLRAYRSLDRIEWNGEHAFLNWLGSIAEHVILPQARRQKRARPAPVDSRIPAPGISPSEAMERNRRFERLQNALDSLHPEARQVVLLARIDGFKLSAIAERMGRSPEAVRMLLRRSVRKLKDHIGETESFHLPQRRLEDRGEP
jgi:RNA polymerase sigma factor (sigma-70 family)